jgi:hypothetical protein
MTAGTVFGFDGDGNLVNTIVSSHNTKAGWTLGGGLEGRLGGNWTAKIEYLYLDLGHDHSGASAGCDDRGRLQFPHHRQHPARRRELQIRCKRNLGLLKRIARETVLTCTFYR